MVNSSRPAHSIFWKCLAILVPAITLVAVITMAAYTVLKINSAEDALIEKVETISQVHSAAVAHSLWNLNFEVLTQSIQTIALHPEIVCVEVIEIDTSERVQWPADCIDSGDAEKQLSKNLILSGDLAGLMNLYYTNRPQHQALVRELLTGAIFFFLLISAAGVIAYLTLQYTVGRPINRLMKSIDNARDKNELDAVAWPTNDELGKVISSYNTMINQIDSNTRELVAARQQAEAATYAKSRFLANMSHELRTPLHAVIGITEMLREEAEEKQVDTEPYVRVAMSGRHLLRLIDDVLDFSKMEAGKITISTEQIDLGELLEEVCLSVEPMAASRNNQLELSFTGTPAYLTSDPVRLKQILINLLSNACKFTKDGEVILDVGENHTGVQFSISDTGIGISKDQQKHLFTDFFQADISSTREFGGTGLGLAISQQLCKLLGGEIAVESSPEEGSIFSFTLSNYILQVENRDDHP